MKEVTHEDWQKNSTPRMMWVWDSNKKTKEQRKIIYISKLNIPYPVFALTGDNKSIEHFRHCAEIEKQRRMTNRELSRWLREHPSREYKYQTSDYIYSAFNYRECKQDEEVHKDIRIREDGGEWREPLVADHYKED